jgi:hypothetical protein
VYEDFFESRDIAFFQIKGESETYEVTFNNVTDLRFGGRFKSMFRMLEAAVGDYLIIEKKGSNQYIMSLNNIDGISPTDYEYCFTGTKRHIIATVTSNGLKTQYIR